MSDQRIDIEEIGSVTVARFLDKKILDEANIDKIGQELFGLVDQDGRKQIILDFSLVEYLSSAALGKLITMHKKVTAAGGKCALCTSFTLTVGTHAVPSALGWSPLVTLRGSTSG